MIHPRRRLTLGLVCIAMSTVLRQSLIACGVLNRRFWLFRRQNPTSPRRDAKSSTMPSKILYWGYHTLHASPGVHGRCRRREDVELYEWAPNSSGRQDHRPLCMLATRRGVITSLCWGVQDWSCCDIPTTIRKPMNCYSMRCCLDSIGPSLGTSFCYTRAATIHREAI